MTPEEALQVIQEAPDAAESIEWETSGKRRRPICSRCASKGEGLAVEVVYVYRHAIDADLPDWGAQAGSVVRWPL